MAQILDIDLDVFVSPIEFMHRENRPDDVDCTIWPEEDVRRFLEEKCSLNRANPKPGLILEDHDALYDGMAGLIQMGRVQTPFDLIHVDAHADLGLGQGAVIRYVLEEYMTLSILERANPVRGAGGLNRGSVILFLAGMHWLRSLAYVHHPDDGNDLPLQFLDYDVDTDQPYLRLPRYENGELNSLPPDDWRPREAEVKVPLYRLPISDLTTNDYDIVILTRSPGFTPRKADVLFDLMSEYVQPFR